MRAFAVVPVILFHAGLTFLPGGYVGVDVFFVISGYLISGLLLFDLDIGRRSLAQFYERRARRNLPAMFVVVALTLPLAFTVMLPGQFRELSESVVTVVLFLSNLYFLTQIDYFAPDAELQPLLHTWSLAVEGQFYLAFPLLLAVLWRAGRSRMIWDQAALALALAGITWRLVEQPFRRRAGAVLPRRRQVFAASAMAVVTLAGIGIAGQRTNGFEPLWRWIYPGAARITEVIATAQTATLPQDDGACRFNVGLPDDATFQRVLDCASRHGPGVAILGDSHAIDLFGTVSSHADRPFVAGFTRPACRPASAVEDCQYDELAAFVAANPDKFSVVLFEMSGAYLVTLDGTDSPVQSYMQRLPLDAAVPDLVVDADRIAPVPDHLADLLLPVAAMKPCWHARRVTWSSDVAVARWTQARSKILPCR